MIYSKLFRISNRYILRRVEQSVHKMDLHPKQSKI